MSLRQEKVDGFYAFGDTDMWPTDILHAHAKLMLSEKKDAIAHKAEHLEQALGYAAFELWYRAHWEPEHSFDELPVAEVATT